ncbi:ABC transporter substrate-binding protein [Mumia sp. ZJ1417]|uniref:heme/hemin ABC transporter substrate-binding protein n=1 Tax=Mumia sp. ZJ1417 TaxID=2708082 RepID=UPI0014242DC5|nr:ABC transporter substrate-binding protein [Mumia sp. ZJ1417]QMW65617.1 ABC transporter substrate-binding protein [Mumia sp. ZJ1417]
MRRRLLSLVSLLCAGALLSGCATGVDGEAGAIDAITTIPSLADVEVSASPKDLTGEISVDLGADEPEPVTTDPTRTLPVTVKDSQGTRVAVKSADRVLALDQYGTLSQIVYELGLGDTLVGRDVSTQFNQAKDLPLVTHNGHELNGEAILDLSPDLIITDTSLGPWDVIEQVRDAGVPVVVVDSKRNLDNVAALIAQVASPLGVPEAGKALAKRTADEVAAVRTVVDQKAPSAVQDKLRTVFLYVRGQSGVYYMFGEDSGADALISATGAYDVSAEIGWKGMKPLNDEGIVAAQPDTIIMMTKGLESAGGVDGLLERYPSLANTPAGKNRRFLTMPDSQILSFGPRSADVINALAVAMYAPESLQ